MALEQREQGQLPRITAGMLGHEAQFFIAWAIQRLEFIGGQRRLKTRLCRTIEAIEEIAHQECPKKGALNGPIHPLFLKAIPSIKYCPTT